MPDVALIAASATAGAAVVGLIPLTLREIQRHRDTLDSRVQRAVDAAYGKSLKTFRELEQQLTGLISQARSASEEVTVRVGELEQQTHPMVAKLQGLIEEAAGLIPTLPSPEVIPEVLLRRADHTPDAGEATALLRLLLDHPDATSEQLERGGDLARQELQNERLAIRFYKRSADVNPANLSARAEILALEAHGTEPRRHDAFAELITLAEANPNAKNAITKALNAFVDESDYEGMLRFIEQILPKSVSARPLLLRNKAVALNNLQADRAEVDEAYEQALLEARRSGAKGDAANIIRPYASLLVRRGTTADLEHARILVLEGLWGTPTDAGLYLNKGAIEAEQRDFDEARKSFNKALKFGDPDERSYAQNQLEELEAREGLVSELAAHRAATPPDGNYEDAPASKERGSNAD
jgi:hypothetical protein